MSDEARKVLEDMGVLSDEELEGVVGELTDGDRKTLSDYVKRAKLSGYTLSDAITEIQNTYTKPWAQRYVDEYIEYVCEIW